MNAPRDEQYLSTSLEKPSHSSRIPDSSEDDPPNYSAFVDETAGEDSGARAGDPLGLPARTADPGSERLPVSRTQQQGSVDAVLSVEDSAGDGPIVVTSTPEEVAEATAFFDTWAQNETEGQKRHAKARSTVFSIMQYRSHPDTGEILMTEEQWDGLIAVLDEAGVLDRHAAIWHDLDTLPDGSQKPLHFHGVVKLQPGNEKQVRFISKRASIPASRIDVPARSSAEGKAVTGPMAADLAFFDLCRYLTHEDDKSQENGKHLYPRERVKANFDFSAFIDAGRPQKAKRTKASDVDLLAMRIQEGELTLKQALDADGLSFNRAPERMEKSRAIYLRYAELGSHRTNYYFGGPSGTGKTFAATMFAEALGASLYPELSREEMIFTVGRKGVEFQQYDGQPIVIWDDFRVGSIIHAFGGTRDAVWAGLDVNPNRSKVFVHRKYGSVRLMNVVNIITGVESYGNFIENLAGNYKDKDGNEHEAEDPIQAYRRMPFVSEVTAETVSFYLNQGFADTGSYREYSKFAMLRANMRLVAETLEAIEDDDEREATMVDTGQQMFSSMVEAHRELRPKRDLSGDDALSQIMGSVAVLTGDDLDKAEAEEARKRAEAHEKSMRARAAHELKPDALRHFEEDHLDGLNTPDPMVTPWDTSIAYSSTGELHCHFCPPDDDSGVGVAEAEEARRRANEREAAMRKLAACELEPDALRHFEDAHLDGLNTPDPRLTPWGPPIAYSPTGERVCFFCRSAADSTDPTT